MRKLSAKRRKEAFFYAQEEEAAIYDDIADLTLRDYREVHSVLIDLLSSHLEESAPRSLRSVTGTILDAGCGTGIEGLGILAALPSVRLVGLDVSPSMLACFRSKYEKIYGSAPTSDRCVLLCEDLLSSSASAEALLQHCQPSERSHGFLAIVTVFALHHYSADEKLEMYARFFSALRPGGIFLNADLFGSRDPRLETLGQRDLEGWIADQFSRPPASLVARLKAAGHAPEVLRERFLDHVRKYNTPMPVEFCDDTLRSPPTRRGEYDILAEAGFQNLECPYRRLQSGIIWATK